MVTIHVLGDGQGNLAAGKNPNPILDCTRILGKTEVDDWTWQNICNNPDFADRRRLNEFLRQLIPAQVEEVLALH